MHRVCPVVLIVPPFHWINRPDNAFIEAFNGRLRDECLNANWASYGSRYHKP